MSSSVDARPAAPRRRWWLNLPTQVLLAAAVGITVGTLSQAAGLQLQILGTIFTHLIQMVIVPLMFPLIILSIATMESTRALGRMAFKSLLYFEIVTTAIIVLGLVIANIVGVGKGVHLPVSNTSALDSIQKGVDFNTMILQVFPSNIVQAMTQGNMLPLLVFGAFFGIALAMIGEKAAPVKSVLNSLSQAMFRVMHYIIRLTPLGVFGLMAYAAAKYGLASLLSIGQFILVLYAGYVLVAFGLFALIGLVFGVYYWDLFRKVFPATLIAFVSRSTEVALAPLLERLDAYGVSRKTYSFTVPLSYSFNTSGSAMYQAVALMFIANAYGVPMPIERQITTILVLMLLTKGIANVPSASIVTLLAAATTIGLPPEGVAILLAIDFFADMPRTGVTVLGDALASTILDRSEGTFTGRARRYGLRMGWGSHAAAEARRARENALAAASDPVDAPTPATLHQEQAGVGSSPEAEPVVQPH